MVEKAHAFDKAAWHLAAVRRSGLPDHQAYVHGGLFFGWAASRGLVASWVQDSTPAEFERFRKGEITGPALFAVWDGAILDDQFTDEGLAFVVDYVDPRKGGWLHDYAAVMAAGLPSEFHVKDDAASAAKAYEILDQRFLAWRASADPARTRPDLRSDPKAERDELPAELVVPVLPVTRGVVLPGGTIGIRVARPASVRAVRRAQAAEGRIGLFSLVDPNVEVAEPGPDDLMETGVVATLDRVSAIADRLEIVAACRARVQVRSWTDRSELAASVVVRSDTEPSEAAWARVAEVRKRVAEILRQRMERRESPGLLALAASLDGGALLDHVAREGPLTDDERRLVLEELDLEARASIVLAALSRIR